MNNEKRKLVKTMNYQETKKLVYDFLIYICFILF